jgi:hypothetical protein
MTAEERALLIEQVAAAWRSQAPDGTIRSLPAWHDLDEAGRLEAFELAQHLRTLEAALDPQGRSSTVHAVMAKLT